MSDASKPVIGNNETSIGLAGAEKLPRSSVKAVAGGIGCAAIVAALIFSGRRAREGGMSNAKARSSQ